MDEVSSPVKLKQPAKKRRLSVNKDRCLVCGKGNGKLVNPQNIGKQTFIKAFKQRGTCAGMDTLQLTSMVDADNCVFLDDFSAGIRWHKNCYASYTSKQNISNSFIVNTTVDSLPITLNLSESYSTRSKRNTSIDWKKVCLYCEQTKYRGESELKKVEYEKFWQTLEKKCDEKEDTDLRLKIGGDFSVLPALEARYHNKCHSAYIKSDYVKVGTSGEYDGAFNVFLQYISPLLKSGRALQMSSLTKKFKDILREHSDVSEDQTNSFRTSTLKAKMDKHFSASIIITDQKQRNSSQIVYSSDIQLIDVINSAAEYKALSDFEFGCKPANGLDSSILHKAANILKSDIDKVKGIDIYPLNKIWLATGYFKRKGKINIA